LRALLAAAAVPPRAQEGLRGRAQGRLPSFRRLSGLALPTLLVSVIALQSVY
jgi:hypothetical protein